MIFCKRSSISTITHGKRKKHTPSRLILLIHVLYLFRHSTIKIKPNEVNSANEQHLLDTVYKYNREYSQQRMAKFKVGDYVRLSKYQKVFDKSYTPNWTTEVFSIRKVQYNTDPITYLLKSYVGEAIPGSVYAEELQLVKEPDAYLVEKIIRRKRGQVYVKWLGFGDEHNSWIAETDLLD